MAAEIGAVEVASEFALRLLRGFGRNWELEVNADRPPGRFALLPMRSRVDAVDVALLKSC